MSEVKVAEKESQKVEEKMKSQKNTKIDFNKVRELTKKLREEFSKINTYSDRVVWILQKGEEALKSGDKLLFRAMAEVARYYWSYILKDIVPQKMIDVLERTVRWYVHSRTTWHSWYLLIYIFGIDGVVKAMSAYLDLDMRYPTTFEMKSERELNLKFNDYPHLIQEIFRDNHARFDNYLFDAENLAKELKEFFESGVKEMAGKKKEAQKEVEKDVKKESTEKKEEKLEKKEEKVEAKEQTEKKEEQTKKEEEQKVVSESFKEEPKQMIQKLEKDVVQERERAKTRRELLKELEKEEQKEEKVEEKKESTFKFKFSPTLLALVLGLGAALVLLFLFLNRKSKDTEKESARPAPPPPPPEFEYEPEPVVRYHDKRAEILAKHWKNLR